MIYLIDFLFMLLFLSMREFVARMQDCRLRLFLTVRHFLFWGEYVSFLIYLYVRPCHTITEKQVSFFMCLFTMMVFDWLITKKKII
jgi:hypothetical protein